MIGDFNVAGDQKKWGIVDFEVVVIGSGVAGLTAAVAAADAGARSVLVAEADTVVGGTTRLSTGFLLGAGTRFQRSVGIVDSAAAFYGEYMLANRWAVDAGIAQTFTYEAGPTIEWLAELGVAFHEELVPAGAESAWRGHALLGGGQSMVDVLKQQCDRRPIDFALAQRVDRLVLWEGAVVGVAVGDDTLRTGAVVVASGGFGANPELLRRYYPSVWHEGWTWYIGSPLARGDAFALGEQAGADLAGHDRGVRLLHANFTQEAEGLLPGWLVLVDSSGRRVVDELAPYAMLDSVARANGDELFVVFDHSAAEQARVGVGTRRRREVPGTAPQHSAHWNTDTIAARSGAGVLPTAATIAELAATLGLPPDRLAATVKRYNESCRRGEDTEFLKASECLLPIATPPFYGARLLPTTVGVTATGLRIDRHARVLGVAGQVVAGLFAAGECTGGVLGDQYFGSGNSLSNGAVFGRIAGQSAASLVRAGD